MTVCNPNERGGGLQLAAARALQAEATAEVQRAAERARMLAEQEREEAARREKRRGGGPSDRNGMGVNLNCRSVL